MFAAEGEMEISTGSDTAPRKDNDSNNNRHPVSGKSSYAKRQLNRRSDPIIRCPSSPGPAISSEAATHTDHDKENCLVNCSLFIPLEQELNKHLLVSDKDFLRSSVALCKELQVINDKRKRRRSEPAKIKTEMKYEPAPQELAPVSSEPVDIPPEIQLKNEPANESEEEPHSPKLTHVEPVTTSSNEDLSHSPAYSLIKKGLQENVLLYDPASKKSWNGLSDMDMDLKELVSKNDSKNLAALIFASNTFQIGCMEEPDPSERNSY